MTADWYKVTLSSADVAGGKHHSFVRAYQDRFRDSGAPTDFGVFTEAGSFGCVYLFSPSAAIAAASLIAAHGGVVCPAPKRSEVKGGTSHQDLSQIPFAPE